MKKILLIVLFTTGVCFGQTYDEIEETSDNGLQKVFKTYKESNNKLELMEFYKNGQPKVFKTYNKQEEKLELVLQVRWRDNGQKWCETTYKGIDIYGFPKPHGKNTVWFPNGQKMNQGRDIDGEHEGLWTVWGYHGEKNKVMFFTSGEKIWEKCWDESGNNCECGKNFNEGCK